MGKSKPTPEKQAGKQRKKLTPAMIAKQWKPGQSGNPKGRPKGITLSESYRHWLQQAPRSDIAARLEVQFGYRPQTNAEVAAMTIGAQIFKGKVDAAVEMRKATEAERIINVSATIEELQNMTDDELNQHIKSLTRRT